MKYHTTIINIIASLVMLLVVLVLVLALSGMEIIPNYGEAISNAILQEFSGTGVNSVSIGSVETALFKRIVIHDLSLIGEDQSTIAHASRIEISVPAFRLLWKRIYPKQLPIIIDGVTLDLDQKTLSLLQTGGTETSDDGFVSSLLTDRTITLTVSNGIISYEQKGMGFEVTQFGMFATLIDGNLTQARLETSAFSLESLQLKGNGTNTTITLGRTATGAVGVRLDSENSSFNAPEIGIESHFDTWRASFIADSMQSLLELDGTVAMTLESVEASLPIQGETVRMMFDSIGADAEFYDGEISQTKASFPSVSASYGEWEGKITSLDASLDTTEKENLLVTFDSPENLHIVHNQDFSVDVFKPNALLSFGKDMSLNRFQLKIGYINSTKISEIASLFDLDFASVEGATMENIYILALINRLDSGVQAESSFDVSVETSLPFLNRVSGQISGSVDLDSDASIQSSQIFIQNLKSEEIDGWIDGNFLYQFPQPQAPEFSLQVSHSNGIQLTVDHKVKEALSRISMRIDNMLPIVFLPILEELSPTVAAFIVPETSLEGNINMTISNDFTYGRGTVEMGIANMAIDEQRFNLATTFTGNLTPDLLNVDLATLTTEGYRLSYTGSIERTRIIPEGILNVNDVESGDIIVTAEFERLASQRYKYLITTPIFSESSFSGDVSWAGEGAVNANGVLSVPKATYPVSIEFEQEIGLVTLVSDNLTASLDFVSVPGHITFDLETVDLPLPPSRGNPFYGQGIINGKIAADFSLTEELFLITSPNLEIEGLAWKQDEPFGFSFSVDADPQEIRLQEVSYIDQLGEITGYATIRNHSLIDLGAGNLDQFFAIARLQGNEELLSVSFFPDEENSSVSRGAIMVENFNLGRFSLFSPYTRLQFSFIGETDLHKLAQGHASVELNNPQTNSTAQSELHLEGWGILLDNTNYRKDNLTITLPEARFSYDGNAHVVAELAILSPIVWRDGSTTAQVDLFAELPRSESLFEWVENLPNSLEDVPLITIDHSKVALMGTIPWSDGTHYFSVEEGTLLLEKGKSGTIEGSYDLESGYIDIRATSGFPLPVHAQGTIAEDQIYLELNNIEFNLEYLNAIFLEPVIIFEKTVATGSLIIDGPIKDPDYYGTLLANSVDVSTFWTPGELFSLKNPVITISENLATIAPSPVSAVHTSGRRTSGTIQMEFSFEQWKLPHYRIDILEIKDPISIWIPLAPPIDVNVKAMASGSFSIDGTMTEEMLYGDVTVSEGQISFGVENLPEWFEPSARTGIDLTLRTGRNVSFIFPNEEAPILRATFADDQEVGISVELPSMTTSFTGELAFRSGEIYYVQKNFYITEGSLRFPPATSSLDEDLLPRINLRARLREFEADGTRVDIYMVLQEARFDNLNPRFESIPLRSTNEILELLGQNIVTAGTARDSGLTSVVAVASAATDVISRLGLVQNTTISLGFSSIIRESLGLDVFTIRTNLLQNILFEALPGISADTTVSPIARYLDNTTMYLGKYLLEDFYLQGMLHFRQDSRGNSISFLANDLRIDTEISVEWTNPLATFSFFTQPDELSVFDLFDTMGFSITKRFEF